MPSRPDPAVLAALAAAEAHNGNLHFARLALRRVDPLRRGALLAKARRAMDEAEERSGPSVFGEEAQRHLARAAYLLAAEQDITQDELADLALIRERYEAERSKHPTQVPRGFPITLSILALLFAGGLAAGLVWFLGRPRTPSLEGARRTPPGPTGAYLKGGRPSRQSSTLSEVFGKALPKVFVAAAHLAEARASDDGPRALEIYKKRLDEARKAALAPPNLRALGEHPAKRLADLLAAIQNAAMAETKATDDTTAKAFHQAVDLLNRELAAGDFAYHLVGDLLVQSRRRLVLLASYGVEEIVRYQVDGEPVNILRLDRLDETNWSPNRLGAQREGHLAPFVEMSTVRRELITYVIPELVSDGGLTYDGRRLSNEMTQKDYREILGDKVADLVALGIQLGKRIRILRRIQRHSQTKLSFLLPDTMARDRELLRLFRRDFNAPVALANELEAILDAIDVPAYRGLVDRIATLHAALTEAFVLQLWQEERRGKAATPGRPAQADRPAQVDRPAPGEKTAQADRPAPGDQTAPRQSDKGDGQAKAPPLPAALAPHLAPLLGSGPHNERVAQAARTQLSGQLAALAHGGPLTRT
ncbi:MAG: hypothetical protein RBU30_24535, partial [Polyangia bacterium]|nr:hypothetical protein [Polyangia bacterium]